MWWSEATRGQVPDWVLSDEVPVPPGARRASAEDARRIKRAITSIGLERNAPELAGEGHRPLRRWRRVDIAQLRLDAVAFVVALEWALESARDATSAPRPLGVVRVGAAEPPRREHLPDVGWLPWWESATVAIDLRTADRLLDVADSTAARRWLLKDKHDAELRRERDRSTTRGPADTNARETQRAAALNMKVPSWGFLPAPGRARLPRHAHRAPFTAAFRPPIRAPRRAASRRRPP